MEPALYKTTPASKTRTPFPRTHQLALHGSGRRGISPLLSSSSPASIREWPKIDRQQGPQQLPPPGLSTTCLGLRNRTGAAFGAIWKFGSRHVGLRRFAPSGHMSHKATRCTISRNIFVMKGLPSGYPFMPDIVPLRKGRGPPRFSPLHIPPCPAQRWMCRTLRVLQQGSRDVQQNKENS